MNIDKYIVPVVSFWTLRFLWSDILLPVKFFKCEAKLEDIGSNIFL